ncbi:peritrophin-48-like [Drosophila albomicans]|uniref:Peritrophin-48-like n=1 Tax=Drosophila albomicans TaxID=7291 RepID=A0A6P8XLJ4_DROAB|nr:peritrophin-48-like [Drosophila albomicans]
MAGYYLLATVLCLAVGNALATAVVLEGTYNVTQVCTMVKAGTRIGGTQSCDYFYTCTSSGPKKATCATGYTYNYKTQSCVPTGQASCYYGLANPCAGNTGNKWVPHVSNCQAWYWCNDDKIAGNGECADGLKFESATQRCVYGRCSSNVAGSGDVSICSVVPPNVYFGATDSCKTWNYCSDSGVLSTSACNSSAFIVSTGECGYSSYPGACDRVTSDPVPTTCTTLGTKQADPEVCGSYYVCDGSIFQLNKCPTGAYYDVAKETCVLRQTAVPIATCNRCQDTYIGFANAVDDKLCNSYYYCEHGEHGSTSTCPTGKYFNEELQACDDDNDLATYVIDNGACSGAKATDSSEADEDSAETKEDTKEESTETKEASNDTKSGAK